MFQGKENEMRVLLSDFMNAVIFVGPLNLSQSSEEAKVAKTKDVTKVKGSSKSRVDNQSAPPPLPDLPTGMACDRCISFACVSLFDSFIPSLKIRLFVFQLRP